MANTTNKLPETLEQKLDNLTMTVNSIWTYLQQEIPAIKTSIATLEERLDKRIDALEEDARTRYIDLRKRIDRLDGHFDIVIEEVVDYKKRVRSLERDIADTRILKN